VKLKLDANLGTRGCRLLIDAGHDVSTAAIQGLAQSSDEALIAACAAEKRALISLDTDFANAMRYPPSQYAGIVVIRTLPRSTAIDIEAALGRATSRCRRLAPGGPPARCRDRRSCTRVQSGRRVSTRLS